MSEQQLALLGHAEQDIVGTAEISPDGNYRYTLTRRWGPGQSLTWIMLNPSTADHRSDDATIRRCIGFARRLGYDGITVANLFAFRSAYPRDLLVVPDPVGPSNDATVSRLLALAAAAGSPVVAGWGAHQAAHARVDQLLAMPNADRLHSFGVTADGHPRHPLYLPSAAELAPWPPQETPC